MKLKKNPVGGDKTATEEGNLRYIPLEAIVTHKALNHRKLDKGWAQQLEQDIKANGLDVPLVVWNGGTPDAIVKVGGKKYPATYLLAGAHRRKALELLRKSSSRRFKELFSKGVPVIVKDGGIIEASFLQIRENLQRKNPDQGELISLVTYLRDKHSLKGKEIAARTGRSPQWVSSLFTIENELGAEAVKKVKAGKLSLREARDVAHEVQRGKKKGKAALNAKALLEEKEKARQKLAESGRLRQEKRWSAKKVFRTFEGMPRMTTGNKANIAIGGLAYLAGAREKLPKEYLLGEQRETKETSSTKAKKPQRKS